MLDLDANPVEPTVRTTLGKLIGTMCARCLRFCSSEYYASEPGFVHPVAPSERWRFRKPSHGRRWHITREDFYADDQGSFAPMSACESSAWAKPGGGSLPADQIDEADVRLCRHCLRLARNGGHVERQ